MLGVEDVLAPVVAAVEVSPATVDTRVRSAVVRVSVRVTDEDGGVQRVTAWPRGGDVDDRIWLPVVELREPTRGTRADGWWDLDLTLPQGLPPGAYPVDLFVEDLTHWVHVSPGPGTQPSGALGLAWPTPVELVVERTEGP